MSGLEILGVAASIGALVEVADRAYKVVFKYLPAIKNARKDVQQLITEIRTLCGVLHSLRLFAASLEDDNLLGPGPKASRIQHVESCYHTLSKIRSDLEKCEADFNSKNKLKGIHRSLRWPFSEEETAKLLDRVAADKQTMNLAMTVDSTNALLRKLSRHHEDTDRQMAEIQSDVRRTLEITRRVEINTRRQEVLSLFNRSEAQASEYLETSVASRFPLTGLWLTQGDQFREWLSTPRSRLWLAGIPGAGKTVLAGAMIEEALSLCNLRCAVAFFFCDSSKGTVTSLTDLLGALSAQLARQNDDAFDILEKYQAQLCPQQGINRAVTDRGLRKVLEDMIDSFDRVYIIVDGLDEYGTEALRIIQALTDVWESTETCSIAFLSRDETFIRDDLENDFQYIQVTAHKEDIEPYVIAKIQERFGRKKKRKMSDMTKDAITKALVEGSDGMFRWVSCMVDFMCEFSTDRERLEALKNLPPDLGKIYQRILDRVNQKGKRVQMLVQRILCLIDFREAPITIAELLEAVSTSISHPEDLITEDEIVASCSSLIQKSNDGARFEFAHFTVREFLRSEDLLKTPYEKYHISDAKVSVILASTSIRFLLQPEFSNHDIDHDVIVKRAIARGREHPLYSYAAKFWTTSRDKSWWDDDEVRQLLLQLLEWPKTGHCTNWAMEFCRHLMPGNPWFGPRALSSADGQYLTKIYSTVAATVIRVDFTPLHLASLLNIPWLTQHLLSTGLGVNSSSRAGTPLHCAVIGIYIFSSNEGVLPNISQRGDSLFEFMGKPAKLSTVKILLDAGANHSQVCHTAFWSHTPLCVALHAARGSWDFTLFLELLKAGASIDRKTLEFALDMFQPNITSALPVETDMNAKAMAGLTAAVQGILEITANRPADQDESAALRTATIRFISGSKVKFTWGPSITKASYESLRVSDNIQETIQAAKLAIKLGDVQAVDRILTSSSINLANQKVERGGTLLHYSVQHTALDMIPILVSKGFDVNAVDDDRNTALNICAKNEHVPLLRELLLCGARTGIANRNGRTIWHSAAWNDAFEILEALIHDANSGEGKAQALSRKDNHGYTPFFTGLSAGHVKPSLLLLRHSEGKLACFSSPINRPLYLEVTLRTNSAELLRAMIDSNIPPDPVAKNGDTPLHYLRMDHGPEFVSLLKGLYPNVGQRTVDNLTPLKLLVSRLFYNSNAKSERLQTIKELIRGGQARHGEHESRATPERQLSGIGTEQVTQESPIAIFGQTESQTKTEHDFDEVRQLWPMIGTIFPTTLPLGCLGSSPVCTECSFRLNALCDFLLDNGALEDFEKQHHSSGLIPLLGCFKTDDKWLENFITGAQMQISRAVRETKHWESAKSHPIVLQFFGEAVFKNWPWSVELILARGIDVHASVESVSALEKACLAGSRCSTKLFETILGSADGTRLNDINYTNGLGLIHLLAVGDSLTCSGKLKILTERRVDVNLKTSIGTPAMILHLYNRSFDGARILLEAGADPSLVDTDGWDSILAAVGANHVEFLEHVKRIADPSTVNWQRVCTIRKDGNVLLSGCNALHVAAGRTAGGLECIRFYLEGGYLDHVSPKTAEGISYLHRASMVGHADVIRLLGSHCTAVETINSRDLNGRLPLDIGIRGGKPEVVKALLDIGADKTQLGFGDNTAIVCALMERKFEILKLLDASEKDKRQDFKEARNEQIISMRKGLENSITGSQLSSCKELWERGCPFNKPLLSCGACSPLLLALLQGKAPIVAWMLETMNGTRLNILGRVCNYDNDLAGTSPATLVASTVAYIEVLPSVLTKYLEAGGSPFLEQRTPIHTAAQGKNSDGIRVIVQHIKDNLNLYRTTHSILLDGCFTAEDVVKTLINAKSSHKNSNGETALHIAVLEGSVETVVQLLENQADPNQQDVNLKTSLHIAVINGNGSPENREKIVKALLNAGANLELQGLELQTPLLRATLNSKVGIVRLLLEQGADLHALDKYGFSALGYSSEPSLFLLFLERGLDPFFPNCYQLTPAHYALARQRTRTLILNRLDIRDIPPLGLFSLGPLVPSSLLLQLFMHLKLINRRQTHIGRPIIFQLHPEKGKSPLYFACEYGDVKVIGSLLLVGAQVDFPHSDGKTPLLAACSHGRLEAVKLLVEVGASITYEDKTNTSRSALVAAAKFPNIVKWLLVERFSHRKKLNYQTNPCVDDEEHREIRPWSGLWAAQLLISRADRDWAPGRDFADFAHRNSKLRRAYAGKVVSGIKPLWPANDLDSFKRSPFFQDKYWYWGWL